jgi:hypothetical protein
MHTENLRTRYRAQLTKSERSYHAYSFPDENINLPALTEIWLAQYLLGGSYPNKVQTLQQKGAGA